MVDGMRIHLYSPVFFERWDHRASDGRGIGGSETCATEMAWRLARRGYDVTSYAPIPRDCPRQWRGTEWLPLEKADFTRPGLWIIFRDAACLDKLPKTADQQVWLLCQDEAPRAITPERAAKVDRVLALCQWHKAHLERQWPELRGKVWVTSNGIKTDLIREAEGKVKRNPKRLIYASSPDRGLLPLLKIFRRAREFEPELELHCFYGTNNIRKLIKFSPRFEPFRKVLDKLMAELKQPGVTWHGRVSQRQLYREWLASGLWVYPCSAFSETSCITCMEAQALGAVPITCPRAALRENVRHGVFIEGDAHNDPLTQARYVAEILRHVWYPVIQDDHRRKMMPEARAIFGWERQVDQWEAWLHGWPEQMHVAQFAFQRKWAAGRVLNVGCADDPINLGALGTNLDALHEIPWTKAKTKAHVYHDARQPIPKHLGRYDTIVCGDILEHMTDRDAVKVLRNCRAVLNTKGSIVITCPEDYRPEEAQHDPKLKLKYPAGESPYHTRPITRAIIGGWLKSAGLKATRSQVLDYGEFAGNGVVACL